MEGAKALSYFNVKGREISMSSYHTSFSYLGKNSYDDFNLQIAHFESGDSGEVERIKIVNIATKNALAT